MLHCAEKFGQDYCFQLCSIIKVEYYSAIIEVDAAIAKVVTLLDTNGLRNNTFVIFYSDNGPARFYTTGPNLGIRYVAPGSAGGLPGYKYELREGGIHTPAFVHFPALITQNSYISVPIGNVDLLPTVVELSGNNRFQEIIKYLWVY
jgi:arylsulfatase A